VYVCASRTETQCLSLLEAAGAALPLVALDDPPLAATVHAGRNGVLVHDEESLAREVLGLLADAPRRERWGRESIAIARDASAAKRSRALIQLYALAVREFGGPRGTGQIGPDEREAAAVAL
jgi:glycosyltransferase involved in cell wall biosynthesis